ncbi:MAG: TIR domain-containing protein [Cycloclasticus sp.]
MNKLNLFISYSHLDENHINEFRKHIYPLNNNGSIGTWYDRKILAGQGFQNSINNNIECADIICLLISANFLSSPACLKEKAHALKLNKNKKVVVIPIILSACGWLDDVDISPSLALPTDGNAIENYSNSNDAWNNVYEGLKPVINFEKKIKNITINEPFLHFLENAEMLTKAHSKKEKVALSDIFIFPDLRKYGDLREYEKSESSEILINSILDYSKVLIAGENQSGKTTLCKKIFLSLRERNYFPVYVSDKNALFLGKLETKITSAFSEQYEEECIDEVRDRIIPIVDDFHFAKHKEKNIRDLSAYQRQVLIVDDIFSLNIKDESIIQSYTHFKIKELSPSLRNKLIEKWTHLTEYSEHRQNDEYHKIDKTTELVNNSLGKVIGSGIMPAYPFFVLTVISTNEAFGKSLDQEITSQGYCYQALIYLYLRKEGVGNEEIDTYVNFLTEFSFYFHTTKKEELSENEFNAFMRNYLDKYNLPIKKETLLDKLQKTQIIIKDNFGNYFFCYPYLYYFFVAKYLSEHIEDNKKVVDIIIQNLHKDENAYIAIFISHHSKNGYILDEIMLNAGSLFENYAPATLKKDETKYLDDHVAVIINEVLPSTTTTPEKERAQRLDKQDKEDQLIRDADKKDNQIDDDLEVELRRSIKTVEVMGRIIKNRAGSLEKRRLEEIFEEAMKVHLRILTSFFEIVENDEDEVIDFISSKVKKIIEKKDARRIKEAKKTIKPTRDELKKLSTVLFWNMNFFFIYGLVNKIVHSLGSDMLTEVIEKVCDKQNTPASFLVKHGILMWYNKNIQINNIVHEIEKNEFSETSKKVLNFLIVNHCAMHAVDFKSKQKIESKLGIPSQKLLPHPKS